MARMCPSMGVQITVARKYTKGLDTGVYTSLAPPQGKGHLNNEIYDAVQAGVDFLKEDVYKLQSPRRVLPKGKRCGL